jgi:hypothetical protein
MLAPDSTATKGVRLWLLDDHWCGPRPSGHAAKTFAQLERTAEARQRGRGVSAREGAGRACARKAPGQHTDCLLTRKLADRAIVRQRREKNIKNFCLGLGTGNPPPAAAAGPLVLPVVSTSLTPLNLVALYHWLTE